MTAQQVKNLKRFDDFDVRALKALGKWENEDCLKRTRITHQRRKTKRKVLRYEEESEPEESSTVEEEDEAMSYENNDFSIVNVKAEAQFENPLVEEEEEESPIQFVTHSEQPNSPKRRKVDDSEDTDKSKVVEDNTKAIKQHTAAIMGLTDSINALTSTIRSYLYNK